jgi:hypothetical protein
LERPLAGPSTGRFKGIAIHAVGCGKANAPQSSIAARARSVTSAAASECPCSLLDGVQTNGIHILGNHF